MDKGEQLTIDITGGGPRRTVNVLVGTPGAWEKRLGKTMKIEMTATEKLTEIDEVHVRLREGTTEQGTACKVFVHRIAVHNDDDASQFEAELREQLPPGKAVDLRHIL